MKKRTLHSLRFTCLVALLALGSLARATTYNFIAPSAGGSPDLNDGANWQNATTGTMGTAPGINDDAVWNIVVISNNITPVLTANMFLNSLTVTFNGLPNSLSNQFILFFSPYSLTVTGAITFTCVLQAGSTNSVNIGMQLDNNTMVTCGSFAATSTGSVSGFSANITLLIDEQTVGDIATFNCNGPFTITNTGSQASQNTVDIRGANAILNVAGLTTLTSANTYSSGSPKTLIVASGAGTINLNGNVNVGPGTATDHPNFGFPGGDNPDSHLNLNGGTIQYLAYGAQNQGIGTTTFGGSGAQTIFIDPLASVVYRNLIIGTGSSATVLSLDASNAIVPTVGSSFADTLLISAGATLDIGIKSFDHAASPISGSLFKNNGILMVGGTSNTPANYSAYGFAGTSTVNYYAAANQTVSAQSYGNLIFGGSGVKTFAGNTGIAGDFTLTGSATADATTIATTITYNGGTAQAMGGNAYRTLVANNSTGSKLTIGANTQVNNVVTFTNGIISTRAAGVFLGFANTATTGGGNTTSYVDGNVRKTGNAAFTFPVGDIAATAGTAFHTLAITAPSILVSATVSYVASSSTPNNNTAHYNIIHTIDPSAYWTMAATGSATSTVTIATRDESGVFDPGSQVFLVGYNIANSYWEQLGNLGTLASNGAQNLTSRAPVRLSSYSAFTVGSTTYQLPITLVSFNVTASGCTANLAWQTATEQNSSYYAVEASTDGKSFVQVAKVTSKNNPTGAAYSFNYALARGTNYFRLKPVDFDGKFDYSSIVGIIGTGACGTAPSVKVSPNPTSNILEVQGLAIGSTLSLYAINGKKMTSVIATGTNEGINIGQFAKGMYVLRIQAADGTISNVKVVRE